VAAHHFTRRSTSGLYLQPRPLQIKHTFISHIIQRDLSKRTQHIHATARPGRHEAQNARGLGVSGLGRKRRSMIQQPQPEALPSFCGLPGLRALRVPSNKVGRGSRMKLGPGASERERRVACGSSLRQQLQGCECGGGGGARPPRGTTPLQLPLLCGLEHQRRRCRIVITRA